MNKRGLLLINLGTPDDPTIPAVRRYLREFLADPRVIDIAAFWRYVLLYLFILPFRPKRSAHAYQQVWRADGSPLQVFTRGLTRKMQGRLAKSGTVVSYAMRYQNPVMATVAKEFIAAGVTELKVVPLFPQYSSAAWGSAMEQLYKTFASEWNVPAITSIPPFYEHPAFIDVFAKRTRVLMNSGRWDHILISFHGLPVRHCRKSVVASSPCSLQPSCCDSIRSDNAFCYRAQCNATAHGIARVLGLKADQWSMSFQSRLGRTPWIKPYTDLELDHLVAAGKKDLLVLSPSFVADCLETLEEIALRAKEQFIAAGGHSLRLVPSLNDDDDWVDALCEIVEN